MMTAGTFTEKGEAGERVNLPAEVFGVRVSPTLLAQAVRVYLGNQRKSRAKTKHRGEVAKTTAKMYKQKGTGRARHGSYSAPIFVGGGVAHGPRGMENWHRKLPAAMTKRAILGALSQRAGEKRIVVITGADKASGKSREAAKAVAKMGEAANRPIIVVTAQQKEMARGWRNLAGAKVLERDRLNAYEILARKNVMLTAEAMEELKIYAVNN